MLVFTNNINIGEIDMRQDKRKNRLLSPIYFIIPFLTFFFYSLLVGANPVKVVYKNIFTQAPQVKYETFQISFDSNVPEYLKEDIQETLGTINLNGKNRFEFKERGEYVITESEESANVIFATTLVPVGHIYWLRDSVTENELSNGSLSILLTEEQYEQKESVLKELLGVSVEISQSQNLLSDLRESESTVAFVEPEDITKDMKMLQFNEKLYLEDDQGSVNVSYVLESEEENTDFVYSIVQKNLGEVASSSFDSEKLVKINMTGVTAIARGLASRIDASGNYGYPAQSIGEFLADADLTHTSNEVSFVEGCTGYTGMRFCSKPQYIETLRDSGIDIVELTGNHNNDYGSKYNTSTINQYKEEGWEYFGGGLDINDAQKILYKDVKGSKVAFVGYNYYDTMQRTGAIASDSHAGSNSYSESKLQSDIEEAKENADVVIVTFQFQECYSYPPSDVIYPICYKPLSNPDQKSVFRQAVDFGADVVIGTQAHQPQTYEVYKEGLIFYGLGNLYFDQTRWIGTRQGLVVSLYILEGDLVQVKLTPTIYDKDMITRLANEQESKVLLEELKKARNF